jgi:hypothetical protein
MIQSVARESNYSSSQVALLAKTPTSNVDLTPQSSYLRNQNYQHRANNNSLYNRGKKLKIFGG